MEHARASVTPSLIPTVSAAIQQSRLVIAAVPVSRQVACQLPVGPLDVNKGGMVSGDKKENL